MKPYVVCHMMSSVDGHALTDLWDRPFKKSAGELYESLAQEFKFDAWICGRVTMQEISHGDEYPRGLASVGIPRAHHFAKRDAALYAVSIDPHGKVAWKSNEPRFLCTLCGVSVALITTAFRCYENVGHTKPRNTLHTQVALLDFLGAITTQPIFPGFFCYPVSRAGGAVAFA